MSKSVFKGITFNFQVPNKKPMDTELANELLDKVNIYKDQVLNVLDEEYNKIKFRLESYFRNLVKEQLETGVESIEDSNGLSILTRITNEHHNMLLKTREQYEDNINAIEENSQKVIRYLLNYCGESENTSEGRRTLKSVRQCDLGVLKKNMINGKSNK